MSDRPARNVRPVVFLDRDGTINEEMGYLFDVEDLRLIPGAARAVARLNEAGIACVVVTNQSGPARGYFSEEHVRQLNERLVRLLMENGARVEAVYYCPHHREGKVPEYSFRCDCRKPATGMIERALAEHPAFDRARAYVVGDQATDVELAKNAGFKSVLVKTGLGAAVLSGQYQWPVTPEYLAESIEDAVDWILQDLDRDEEALS